jgi:hypothetical protein
MRVDATIHVRPTRYVIVHYHIFKDAGSTIESILEREFPGGFATLHGPSDNATIDSTEVANFLRKNANLVALSSHHIRYPKPVLRHAVVFDCCFLRHPLDRLDSVYTYLRNISSPDPFARRAREESPREFIKTLIDEAPHLVSDVHVHQLARAGEFTRPACEEDLERATRILHQMAIPGVVEMFDESLVAAEYFLRPAFPSLKLEYIPRNVSRPLMPILERQDRLKSLWGADMYAHLARLNEHDLELFRRAKDEITRRFALLPSPDERLAEFRSRCSTYAWQHQVRQFEQNRV